MRHQSTTLIGSFVGIAIFADAMNNPGGTVVHYDKMPRESVSKTRFDSFCAYLERTGNSDLVPAVSQEYYAGVYIRTSGLSGIPDYISQLIVLVISWSAQIIILANIVILIVLSALSYVAVRLFKLTVPRPVPARYRFPIIVGMLLGISVCVFEATDPDGFASSGWAAILTAVPIILFPAILRRKAYSWKIVGMNLALAYGVALALGLLLLGSLWEANRCLVMVSFGSDLGSTTAVPYWLPWVVSGMASVACILICLVWFIVSLVRKVPVLNGTLLGIIRAAVPTACILTLLYGCTLTKTIAQERIMNYEIEQQVIDEPEYSAVLAGKTWPGPTDWEPAITH